MSLPDLVRRALLYGIGAFAIGFVFGAIRELVLVPAAGHAMARIIEFPIVTLSVAAFGAYLAKPPPHQALIWGLAAVALLIAIESFFALVVVGLTLSQYLAAFDITKGALFPWGLVIMAVTPALAARMKPSTTSTPSS